MRFRHATALALTGWYLILPPAHPSPDNPQGSMTGPWLTDVNAKLKDWEISGRFDDAADCEQGRTGLIKDFADHEHDLGSGFTRAFRIAGSKAQCISTDDPRLKGK